MNTENQRAKSEPEKSHSCPQTASRPEGGATARKVIFWLAPNEILIPAHQVPGAIADALYPRPGRDGGPRLNDPDTVPRHLAEREHAKMLQPKFPLLKYSDKFSIGDLNDYLASLGMAAELRHRRDVPAPLDPENRWSRRQFEDAFNAVREPVAEAQHSASELSAERCTELAGLHEILLNHWIDLVGWDIGQHKSYDVGDGGVTFRNWQDEYISAAPIEWQSEMKRDNHIAPRLEFPCTPAELVEFVDTAIGTPCFMVPDAFRLAVASNTQAERCNELDALPELFVHHWEELTGIGICKGGSYIVSQFGIYPEQHSDDDLRLLLPEERRLLLEGATRPPLLFPCTPSQLLKFVDGGSQGEFEVPEEFRTVVEPRGQLPQKDSEQNISFGAPESAEPSATTALSESKHGKPSTIDAADSPEPTEIRKRAALIAEVIGFWPRIGLDLSDSSRNGLSKCPLRQNSCRLDRISPGAVTKDGNGKVLGEIQSKSSSEIAAA